MTAPVKTESYARFLRPLIYQVVRQFALLANIDARVKLAQGKPIVVRYFETSDAELAQEYMAERYPGIQYSMKRMERSESAPGASQPSA